MKNQNNSNHISTLQDIITSDAIFDYARASIEMSDYLRTLFMEGYDSIVIPSRGALPIYNLAQTAWDLANKQHNSLEDRIKGKFDALNSPINRELILPFSADPVDESQTSLSIRRFWTNVLSAIVRRDTKSPHLVFYRFLIEKVAKLSWAHVMPRTLPSEKFIFIDTVISGRAISEIETSFKMEGLNKCYFLLIVDQDGNKLSGKSKAMIEKLKAEDRCSIITVGNLFTEDRGPSVSGLWSTVYPEIMSSIKDRYDWSSNCYGAGSFYWKVSSSLGLNTYFKRKDSDYNLPFTITYSTLSTAYYAAIHHILEKEEILRGKSSLLNQLINDQNNSQDIRQKMTLKKEAKTADTIDFLLLSYFDRISEFSSSPLDKETTRMLSMPRMIELWPESEVSVSSSHLVRVMLGNDSIKKLIESFENNYLNKMDVFSDHSWWFRNI
ncbi:hypothetical protein [Thiothrix winogradskyi]|uniref:Uncharacterized protein n=1 Tax=Thiothrix winogradskyi TaxID=96472 RepID=A0ABY3SUW7_9GAMM|nr:hypothetical protein [Thiothrix winogradskyi]UJS22953.1 hypothetical protein L2Y54_13490 [Thiothrix winogradskyi]